MNTRDQILLKIEDIFKPASQSDLLTRKAKEREELEREKAEYEAKYPPGSTVLLKVRGTDYQEREGKIGFWFISRSSQAPTATQSVYVDITWKWEPQTQKGNQLGRGPRHNTSIELDNFKWYIESGQATILPPR
jgi:hypothetical protein